MKAKQIQKNFFDPLYSLANKHHHDYKSPGMEILQPIHNMGTNYSGPLCNLITLFKTEVVTSK